MRRIGDKDTIVGVATPPGYGGIAILKLSGSESLACLRKTFRPPKGSAEAGVPPVAGRRLLYGFLVEPESGDIVDEVLVSIMEAPRSYTREDVVEINLHGGPVVTRAALAMMVSLGARPAEPGEFTRRAVVNGRMDLTQAEAVADLIHAKTERGARAFARLATGAMGREVARLQERLAALQVDLEAGIEFPEEIEANPAHPGAGEAIREGLLKPIEALLARSVEGRILRSGLKAAILGRPNAGKSTLMNRLLGRERAIVTAIPGTTRDVLEEVVNLGGMPVVLVDTAGFHDTADPIEVIGIQKAAEACQEADLALLVVDGVQPEQPIPMDEFKRLTPDNALVVVNKVDRLPGRCLPPLPWSDGFSVLGISAKYGDGMDSLAAWIQGHATGLCGGDGTVDGLLPNERQRWHLGIARDALVKARERLLAEDGLDELVAEDLHEAAAALRRLMGSEADVDLLDLIFQRFCIGK